MDIDQSNWERAEADSLVSLLEGLLNSGNFSDVKVSCGGRTWDLHKNIICERCPFFMKAFQQGWVEANSGHLTLREGDPQHIDGVIFYIYTGKVTKLHGDHTAKAYTKMYELGDFFDLPGLRQQAVGFLDEILKRIAVTINKHMRGDEDSPEISSEQFNEVRHVVEYAYQKAGLATFQAIRDVVMKFVQYTFAQALQLPQFKQLLREVPALSVDVVTSLAGSDTALGNLLHRQPPGHCIWCFETLDTYEHFTPQETPVDNARCNMPITITGLCRLCDQASKQG